MTDVVTPLGVLEEGDDVVEVEGEARIAASAEQAGSNPGEPEIPISSIIRPILAAALATSAAGLVGGGIFGSWGARVTGVLGAFAGAAYALGALRSRRSVLLQALFPVVLVVAGAASLVPRGESPGKLPTLIGEAVRAGRLFRPPVPYDAGWTPLLLMLTAAISFGASWVAVSTKRPKLAIAIPLPMVALTGITQPPSAEFLAGVFAFLPVLAAFGVIFGEDRATPLDRSFEIKRLARGLLAFIPIVAALVILSSASFLFPKPVYDPNDQPQKPRSVPLNPADDRVLFEVDSASTFTGPWRSGVLDVYDVKDSFWKAPARTLGAFPAGGVLSTIRAGDTQNQVTITVRDLGNSTVLPVLGGTTKLSFAGGAPDGLRYDPRTNLVRMATGRVPASTRYTMALPDYATGDQLQVASVPSHGFHQQLEIGAPPNAVDVLLQQAPPDPWLRLDFLRKKLLANVVASGAGSPAAVRPERVGQLFVRGAKATPYEIVAAEAMLARWSGVPSRIGFGFDNVNSEGGLVTVRPKNSAQWLEVYFEGYGWLPLIGAPNQAATNLDTDPNARFDPLIQPSDDVAVQVYVPYQLDNLDQLYQRLRRLLTRWMPALLFGAVAFFTWPFLAKTHRRAKRRRWAGALGPRERIAVEYAEFRDLATDLNVADIYSTPLEYLYEVRDDAEHAELSWLVARVLYGDLAQDATEADVDAAARMSASLRRRLLRAQPMQSQILAMISRASIAQPYTTEVPNVRQLRRLRRPRLPRLSLRRLRLRSPA